MFLLILAHPGCPRQNLESRIMVAVVVVVVVEVLFSTTIYYKVH